MIWHVNYYYGDHYSTPYALKRAVNSDSDKGHPGVGVLSLSRQYKYVPAEAPPLFEFLALKAPTFSVRSAL